MNKPLIPKIDLTPRGLRLKGLLHEMDRTGNSDLTMAKIAAILGFDKVSDKVVKNRSTEFATAYAVYMTEIMAARIEEHDNEH